MPEAPVPGWTPLSPPVMRDVQEISEDEMVLAFVRAEAASPLRADIYRGAGLQPGDFGPDADLDDDEQNQRRRAALDHARGYVRRLALFAGLPSGVTWYRGVVTVEELGGLRHLRYPTFVQLTDGSRLVRDGASKGVTVHREQLSEHISNLTRAVSQGERHPPLIAVAADLEDVPVILEGNKRASAYARALPRDERIEVIVGVSPSVKAMGFY
jgi:hypothetical protein